MLFLLAHIFLDDYVFSGLIGAFAGGGVIAVLATFFYGIRQARKDADFTILTLFIVFAVIIAVLEYETNFFSSIILRQLTNIARIVFLEPMWIGFLIAVGVGFIGIASYICLPAYKAYMQKVAAQKSELEDVSPPVHPLLSEADFIERSVGPYLHARPDNMDAELDKARLDTSNCVSQFFSNNRVLRKQGPPSAQVYDGQRHGLLKIVLSASFADEEKRDDASYGTISADLPQISGLEPILQTEAEQALCRARASFQEAIKSGDLNRIDEAETELKNAFKIVIEAKNLNAALPQEEAQACVAPAISHIKLNV